MEDRIRRLCSELLTTGGYEEHGRILAELRDACTSTSSAWVVSNTALMGFRGRVMQLASRRQQYIRGRQMHRPILILGSQERSARQPKPQSCLHPVHFPDAIFPIAVSHVAQGAIH
jgi:hypothetical protein